MKKFRLNGWIRLGIVTTILWAIGGSLYVLSDISSREQGTYNMMYNACTTDEAKENTGKNCFDEAWKISRYSGEAVGMEIGMKILFPIPFVWLAAFIFVWTFRWVRKGFKSA